MNKLTIFLLLTVLIACSRKPFVNHKLKLDKVSGNCAEQQNYFRLTSNIGGERYEFEKCLPANFSDDNISSERKGDTVVINFNRPASPQPDVVYKFTLDIDSYPLYSFLTIDGETYVLGSAEK
jgi:hypothetical protein